MAGLKKTLQHAKHAAATKLVKPKFTFNGTELRYSHHPYNGAAGNERTIEVPIFAHVLSTYDADKVLEVGNVMAHYGHRGHDVVDKYETAEGVINEDIVTFESPKKYGLIISVSTLEHVGWDESPQDKDKIPQAVERLRGMLAGNGKLFVSLPIGYNEFLDELLRNDAFPFTERVCMKRVSETNKWEEASWDDIKDLKYDEPYAAANGVVFLTFNRLGA